jgi:hypothetical protein
MPDMDSSLVDDCEATPEELLDYMMKSYGKEWVGWEPETIWTVTRMDSTSDICLFNKNKLMAIKAILSNDMFWKDWITFEKCTLALNNVPPRFDILEEVSPGQMAYAVRVSYDLRRYPGANTPGRDPVFSSEVKSYVAARSYMEGIAYLPEPLDFAQSKLDSFTGEARLAESIKARLNTPEAPADETPEGIGAVRAAVIRAYAFSKKRKPILE